MIAFVELNSAFQPTKEIDNGRFVRNPERPNRLRKVAAFLRKKFAIGEIENFPENHILAVHSRKYYDYLKRKSSEVVGEYVPEVFFVDPIFDTGTPITAQSFDAAVRAVDVTLSAVKVGLEKGVPTYALTRPPGHHAMRNYGGGYCYFNNVAVAARFLEEKGLRVAILDLDFHHGNGTQEIFYTDPNVLFVSIHGTPEHFYPWFSGYSSEIGEGPGEGTNLNIPLPSGTDGIAYVEALKAAMKKIEEFAPDYLLVSLGTDTHLHDPVGHFALLESDFVEIGHALAKLHSKIGRTTFVHEGGYNADANLEAARAVLNGFLGNTEDKDK